MKTAFLMLGLITLGSIAHAGQQIHRIGYLKYNGRCPNYGIALHADPDEENPSGDCIVYPALENLHMTDDAKRAAFAALANIKIELVGKIDSTGVINVQSIRAK